MPFTLKLPEAIASARTSADLDEVAKLGAGLFLCFLLNMHSSMQVGESVNPQAEGDIRNVLTAWQIYTTYAKDKIRKMKLSRSERCGYISSLTHTLQACHSGCLFPGAYCHVE